MSKNGPKKSKAQSHKNKSLQPEKTPPVIRAADSSEAQIESHILSLENALRRIMIEEPFKSVFEKDKADYLEERFRKQSIYREQYKVLEKLYDVKKELFDGFIKMLATELTGKSCTALNVLEAVQQLNKKRSTPEFGQISKVGRMINHPDIVMLMDNIESGKDVFLFLITEIVQLVRQGSEITEEEAIIAEQRWAQTLTEQMKRLRERSNKQGGSLENIVGRVTEWNAKIPNSLTDEEARVRNEKRNYQVNEAGSEGESKDESKDERDARIAAVNGLPFCVEQIRKKAVARNLAKTAHEEKRAIGKQHCELPEPIRLEMQSLGVRQVSPSRQGVSGAINYLYGSDCWKTNKFTLELDPEKRFADDQEQTFPERKANHAKNLEPLIIRRFEIEKSRGSVKGSESNAEYEEVIQRLEKFAM